MPCGGDSSRSGVAAVVALGRSPWRRCGGAGRTERSRPRPEASPCMRSPNPSSRVVDVACRPSRVAGRRSVRVGRRTPRIGHAGGQRRARARRVGRRRRCLRSVRRRWRSGRRAPELRADRRLGRHDVRHRGPLHRVGRDAALGRALRGGDGTRPRGLQPRLQLPGEPSARRASTATRRSRRRPMAVRSNASTSRASRPPSSRTSTRSSR